MAEDAKTEKFVLTDLADRPLEETKNLREVAANLMGCIIINDGKSENDYMGLRPLTGLEIEKNQHISTELSFPTCRNMLKAVKKATDSDGLVSSKEMAKIKATGDRLKLAVNHAIVVRDEPLVKKLIIDGLLSTDEQYTEMVRAAEKELNSILPKAKNNKDVGYILTQGQDDIGSATKKQKAELLTGLRSMVVKLQSTAKNLESQSLFDAQIDNIAFDNAKFFKVNAALNDNSRIDQRSGAAK